MKTEFELKDGFVEIWVKDTYNKKPFLRIVLGNKQAEMVYKKDLERFAVNILKALKSKKLK